MAPVFGYDELPEGVQWFMESARHHGIEVTEIGRGQPFHNLYDAKVARTWEATKDLTGYDHVIMMDASDSLFAAGLGEMFYKWERYSSDFVISGELVNWPWRNRYADHPLKNERFGCINSGFYMGTWEAYRRNMQAIIAQVDDGYQEYGQTVKNQDQAAWWRAYMEGVPMTIDHRCLLSQCTFQIDGRWVMNHDMVWGRRPYNQITKTCPCTFHCNGADKWRMRDLHDQLLR